MVEVINLPESIDLIRSLGCDLCPMCGGTKNRSHTMCGRDYRKLPAAIQKALYRRIGEGYEQAIADAMNSLGKTTFILPPASKREGRLW